MTDAQPYRFDDIAVWPDGSWTELDEIWRGDYAWRSDDYEIVRLDDHARLTALGLAEDFGFP